MYALRGLNHKLVELLTHEFGYNIKMYPDEVNSCKEVNKPELQWRSSRYRCHKNVGREFFLTADNSRCTETQLEHRNFISSYTLHCMGAKQNQATRRTGREFSGRIHGGFLSTVEVSLRRTFAENSFRMNTFAILAN